MTTQPQKPPSPFVTNAIFIGGFLIGAWIVFVAASEMMDGGALGEGSVTVEARVTNTRVMTSRKRGDSYEVTYAFDANGTTYTHKDSTGRTDLWVSLEQSAWETARRSGKVDVQYLPADPWVNRAVHVANDALFGQIAGLVTGLLCMTPAFLWIIAAVRRKQPVATA